MNMNEEQLKGIREVMKKFYDKDGNITEEGKKTITEEYVLAGEFEIMLTDLCNKYVNRLNPNLFGFVWEKVQTGIQMAHHLNRLPPPSKPPEDIFG